MFVSNLFPLILKAEIEAMFCRLGRIVDSFLPMDKVLGQKRGFAFVRFGTKEEANGDVVEGNGRSWRHKRIQVNLSKPELVATGKPTSGCSSQVALSVSKVTATPPSMAEEVYNDHLGGIKSKGTFAMVVAGKPNRSDEVWTIKEGEISGVRAASLVAEAGKKALHCGLVGYLKSRKDGLCRMEH